MKKIKSFSVYGLFGTDDVHIPFDKNVKILIGENGLGKTQILNLFYYTLTKNFFRLSELSFHKLVLEFDNSNPVEITKKSVDEFVKDIYEYPMFREIIDDIGYSQFEVLRNKFIQSKGSIRRRNLEMELSRSKFDKFHIHNLFRLFQKLEIDKGSFGRSKNLNKIEKEIEKWIEEIDIMYFPTYRRVEENLYNLGYNDDDELLMQENMLIQFGMRDVQKRFDLIERIIDRYLKEGFSKISSEILSQLVKGFEETDESFLDRINENDINIILARAGSQLSDADKSEIRNIVLEKDLKNPSSVYLLKKLVEIYEKQKELDDSIKRFRDVCNKYLVDKKVFYDESGIKLYVKSDRNDSRIELSKLSSGEKQIISMFSKIYLSEGEQRFIILFDEPELSLSMIWQKQLLPDILDSKKCDFLLAVTHSPFIFDNDLDEYAVGLRECFKPSNVAAGK